MAPAKLVHEARQSSLPWIAGLVALIVVVVAAPAFEREIERAAPSPPAAANAEEGEKRIVLVAAKFAEARTHALQLRAESAAEREAKAASLRLLAFLDGQYDSEFGELLRLKDGAEKLARNRDAAAADPMLAILDPEYFMIEAAFQAERARIEEALRADVRRAYAATGAPPPP